MWFTCLRAAGDERGACFWHRQTISGRAAVGIIAISAPLWFPEMGNDPSLARCSRTIMHLADPALQDTLPIPLLNQRASVRALGCGIRGDYYGRGYAVAGLHLQQADTLGVAAGFANGRRVHADDFAVVADQHYFGGFVDLRDADDFANALRRFHVDYTFAAAVGEAVFVGGSALAVTVFGDREDERAFDRYVDDFRFACGGGRRERDGWGGGPPVFRGRHRLCSWLFGGRHSYYVVVRVEVDTPDAVGGATHGTDVAFVEAHGHAFVRRQKDDLIAVGDAGGDQFVAFFNGDGVDAVGAHVHELTQRRFLDQAFARGEEDVFIFLLEIAHGEHRLHGFAGLQSDQVADVFTFARRADVGNFVDLEPVNPALVGEN